MPILDRDNEAQVGKYESFVRNHPNKSIMQDPAWSHIKNDWGSEYVYLENENGEIYAAISILIRKIKGGLSLFYAPRGPLCDIDDLDVVKALIEEVRPLAKKYHAFALRMDPEIRYSKELNDLYVNGGFTVKNRNVDFNDLIQPRNNMILYLEDHDEESIMSKFQPRNRNKVRSAGRKGVYTTWDRTDDYVKQFFEGYKFMAGRNEITYRNIDYFYRLRDAYGDRLRIYLAHHEDDVLAGAVTINYYGKVYYLYGGSNNTKRNKNPNQKMQYDMISWGIEEGAEQYDFGGVIDMSEDDGLYKFKKTFCYEDDVTEYIGEIDYVFNKTVYTLFEKLVPNIRKMKKKFRRN
ncbi:lipid II:glycine glycyltransferase FemX [Alkalibacterium sp. MB6]|uniref:lipid II:glycine glycyltransferase FemX n=1 Tax=Alkalibacterium sp. MB6 TaxID=2081965 RepID=UPI00137A3BBC|nr:peptidoglycan bridge formation glycyltransferase FemA/FemB family protein [Alkalibacterium sp. MB6]